MSWRTVRLGELVDNFSVRAKDIGGADGLDFFGVSNEEGIIKTKYAAEDKAEDYKIIEKCCFAYNPYRVNVGSIGLVSDDTKGLISPAYVVFKPKPNSIIPELLFKFLKSDEGLRQIKFYARGTVRQALRFEDLCNIEITIPEYKEQQILYNKLINSQEASNVLDDELQNQLELLKKLRQQLLQDAVQGKLVPQSKSDEPASELLKKIKAEKAKLIAEKKLKKEKDFPPIKPEEIPFDIPENWVWCRLGDLCTELLGGFAFDSTRYSKTETPNQVIRLGNVKPNQLVLETTPVFIDDDYSREAVRAKLHKGDILITMTGTRAKKDYLFSMCLNESDLETKTLFLNQRVGCFRFGSFITNNYINITLKDLRLLQAVFDSSTGAANQANIGVAALKDILIPLPPLSEQKRIVQNLNELMQYCNELEASIKQSESQNEKLLQQVLREALRKKPVEVY